MKNTVKKLLSIFLSALMLITYAPTQVFAQQAAGPEGLFFTISFPEPGIRFDEHFANLVSEEGDMLFTTMNKNILVKKMPNFLRSYNIDGQTYYYTTRTLLKKDIPDGHFINEDFRVIIDHEKELSENWKHALDSRLFQRKVEALDQGKALANSLEELKFAMEANKLSHLGNAYLGGKADYLLDKAHEIDDLLLKSAQQPEALETLEQAMSKYMELYKEIDDIMLSLQQGLPESELSRLANKYTPVDGNLFDVGSLAKEFQVKQFEDFQATIKTFLKRGYSSESVLNQFINQSRGFLLRNTGELETEIIKLNTIVKSGEIPADIEFIKLIPEADREAFLKFAYGKMQELLERNAGPLSEDLFAGLVAHNKKVPEIIDTLESIMKELELNAANKAVRFDSLQGMLKYLEGLKTEKAQAEFLAKMRSKLTQEQWKLIDEMCQFGGDKLTREVIIANVPELSGRAFKYEGKWFAGGVKLGVPFSKLAFGTLVVATAAILPITIVHIDAVRNSFAQAIDPVGVADRVRKGIASDVDKYAYYIMLPSVDPSEDPVMTYPLQFASWALTTADVMTNPAYDKIRNDDIMIIKDWHPETSAVNEQIDKALENLEIPQIPVEEFPQA